MQNTSVQNNTNHKNQNHKASKGMQASSTLNQSEEREETTSNAPVKAQGQNQSESQASPQQEGGELKSLTSLISQSLNEEDQKTLERVFAQVNKYFTAGKQYVNSNPGEAAGLAVTAGMAAWALMYTKPGRQAYEAGASILGPQLNKWLAANIPAKQS